MKEAAGEANMTVVTIILIGIVLAIATVIMNNVMGNISKSAEDASNGNFQNSDRANLPK